MPRIIWSLTLTEIISNLQLGQVNHNPRLQTFNEKDNLKWILILL